jgi:hypothetical protein
VFALTPSEHLSANEIAAAALASQGGRFNPQQQFPVTWPAEPVVARAYIDQLRRGSSSGASAGGVPDAALDEISASLDLLASVLSSNARDAALAARLNAFTDMLEARTGDAITQKRLHGLANTLSGLAARLQ